MEGLLELLRARTALGFIFQAMWAAAFVWNIATHEAWYSARTTMRGGGYWVTFEQEPALYVFLMVFPLVGFVAFLVSVGAWLRGRGRRP